MENGAQRATIYESTPRVVDTQTHLPFSILKEKTQLRKGDLRKGECQKKTNYKEEVKGSISDIDLMDQRSLGRGKIGEDKNFLMSQSLKIPKLKIERIGKRVSSVSKQSSDFSDEISDIPSERSSKSRKSKPAQVKL